MASTGLITKIHNLLAQGDIRINGDRPFDIKLNKEFEAQFYDRLIRDGSLAMGETYMQGWWDCEQLDELFYRIISNKLNTKYNEIIKADSIIELMKLKLTPHQNPYHIGNFHYNTGNDLFVEMLGETMAYSCGYWKGVNDLDSAQTAKYDLICRKLKLEKGMTVIDIGCGWGGLLAYMTQNYGVSCVGLTVASEQYEWAKEKFSHLSIEFVLADYREYLKKHKNLQFDRVVSVGMFEHVRSSNYEAFFKVSESLLKDGGLFLLHTIGNKFSDRGTENWIDKYIFPDGELPSSAKLTKGAEFTLDLIMEDWQNFGMYYGLTLRAWYDNFNAAWDRLKGDKYDEQFYRMWRYYLLHLSGSFKARHCHLWQIVYSKGREDTYEAER